MQYVSLAFQIALLSLTAPAVVFAKTYAPSDLNEGQLPNDDNDITFGVFDGNWVKDIKLPTSPADKTRVKINHQAGYNSVISDSKIDLISLKFIDEIVTERGDEVSMEYDSHTGMWVVETDKQSPNSIGKTIDASKGKFVEYTLGDANWVSKVELPEKKDKLSMIIIKSFASWDSAIDDRYLVAKSTATMKKGDTYVLVYHAQHEAWNLHSTPDRLVPGIDLVSTKGLIPQPSCPLTTVRIFDGNWVRDIYLPNSGRQGDTVTIKSDATWGANIHIYRTDLKEKQRLGKGGFYTFVWRADRNHWALTGNASKSYRALQLPSNGHVPVSTPTTYVSSWNGNWIRNIYLPKRPIGHRVHFMTEAAWSFGVSGHGMGRVEIYKGETVTFVVNQAGNWERETITVDVLLFYGTSGVEKIGETAARKRLVEGFDLTNEALRNSKATFRYRRVGVEKLETPSNWELISDALTELRSLPAAQNRRAALKADIIFYEGAEAGCGFGFIPALNKFNAVAVGTLDCGTQVMRHELGHNMGISDGVGHPDTYKSSTVGNSLEGTIMGGNLIPYYCSPELISPVTKLPLDYNGKLDCVAEMNEVAKVVATHY